MKCTPEEFETMAQELAPIFRERDSYRDEVNSLRKVVAAAMAWHSLRYTSAEGVAGDQLAVAVEAYATRERLGGMA